jgi:hypothetical protein
MSKQEHPAENIKIVKTYFERSQYAVVHKMSDGDFWVQKLTTLAWYKCSSFNEAKGLRKQIADGYSSMGMRW